MPNELIARIWKFPLMVCMRYYGNGRDGWGGNFDWFILVNEHEYELIYC